MGWYFTRGGPRATVVAEILADWGAACIAHKLVGNNLWTVIEGKHPETDAPIKYVALALLEASPTGWGYKPLDETCGPCAVDCPLEFLDVTAHFPPMAFARQWRERVRAYHAGR